MDGAGSASRVGEVGIGRRYVPWKGQGAVGLGKTLGIQCLNAWEREPWLWLPQDWRDGRSWLGGSVSSSHIAHAGVGQAIVASAMGFRGPVDMKNTAGGLLKTSRMDIDRPPDILVTYQ